MARQVILIKGMHMWDLFKHQPLKKIYQTMEFQLKLGMQFHNLFLPQSLCLVFKLLHLKLLAHV